MKTKRAYGTLEYVLTCSVLLFASAAEAQDANWETGGNDSLPSPAYLGSASGHDRDLVMQVDGVTGFRIETTSSGYTPSIVGGSTVNSVTNGVQPSQGANPA